MKHGILTAAAGEMRQLSELVKCVDEEWLNAEGAEAMEQSERSFMEVHARCRLLRNGALGTYAESVEDVIVQLTAALDVVDNLRDGDRRNSEFIYLYLALNSSINALGDATGKRSEDLCGDYYGRRLKDPWMSHTPDDANQPAA